MTNYHVILIFIMLLFLFIILYCYKGDDSRPHIQFKDTVRQKIYDKNTFETIYDGFIGLNS